MNFYLARGAAIRVVDGLTREQRTHDAEIFAELLQRHRILAHHAHRGVAGADAEEDPARRELIDARDRMCGHGRDARAGDRDAGADVNALRVDRRERHRRVAVGPDHLRVGNPGHVVAELLGVTDELPLVDVGIEHDAEFHRCLPSCVVKGTARTRDGPAFRARREHSGAAKAAEWAAGGRWPSMNPRARLVRAP
jgi:hypothetical protein